jgi:MYXO-CTERM domain-containing protein
VISKKGTRRWPQIVVRSGTIAAIACAALATVMTRDARAGCNDGACGRVDWTEITEMDQGAAAAAKFHGGFAWEASPDGWATHPLAGTVSGYFWLTCLTSSGTSAACRGQLAAELAKAGTDASMTFNDTYFNDAGVVRPAGLFTEAESAQAAALSELSLGGQPMNPQVCAAAFALPRNGADAAGPAGAGGTSSGGAGGGSAGTGTSATGGSPVAQPSDDGGCSTSGRGAPASAGFAALAMMAAALACTRRRSRD